MKLEEKLMEDALAGRTLDVEEALLVPSNMTVQQSLEYKSKLERLQEEFKIYHESQPREREQGSLLTSEKIKKAKNLFDFLWRDRPNRYNGSFLLKDVIDAQLSFDKSKKIGNCLGLTSLYTVLSIREKLDPKLALSEGHIATIIDKNGLSIYVENTSPEGFGNVEVPKDCKIQLPQRLVPIVYSSFENSKEPTYQEMRKRITKVVLPVLFGIRLPSCVSTIMEGGDYIGADYLLRKLSQNREMNNGDYFLRIAVDAKLGKWDDFSKNLGEIRDYSEDMLKEIVEEAVKNNRQDCASCLVDKVSYLNRRHYKLEESERLKCLIRISDKNGLSEQAKIILDRLVEERYVDVYNSNSWDQRLAKLPEKTEEIREDLDLVRKYKPEHEESVVRGYITSSLRELFKDRGAK